MSLYQKQRLLGVRRQVG